MSRDGAVADRRPGAFVGLRHTIAALSRRTHVATAGRPGSSCTARPDPAPPGSKISRAGHRLTGMSTTAELTDRGTAVLTALLSMQRQSWEQGVAAQAAIDLGRTDLAVLVAHAAVTRQAADGRLGDLETDPNSVNGGACGE